MRSIGAVILAAGGSTRLGQPKQFLRFRGETLVRHAVEAAQGGNCSPVIVVAGDLYANIEAELKGVGAEIVRNPEWQKGIGTSIRVGLQRLLREEPDLNAVLLMVCDQPFVDAEIVRSLLALRQNGRGIVASRYSDTLGVPALFDRALIEELLAVDDDKGAKAVIMAHLDQVAEFSFSRGSIDIDTASDYEQLVR